MTNHTEATRQPLDEVRDQVGESLKAEQAETLMGAKVDELLTALDGGAAFDVAAESHGFAAAAPVGMTRNAEGLDQQIVSSVFTAPKPTQGRPTFGSIDAVVPGRPESIPLAERDSGKLQLADQSGMGDFVAFVQALRANADVIVNEDVLAAQDLLQ